LHCQIEYRPANKNTQKNDHKFIGSNTFKNAFFIPIADMLIAQVNVILGAQLIKIVVTKPFKQNARGRNSWQK